MNRLDPETSVAQIVVEHPECAPVLRRHGIDFCCHGSISLRNATGDALPTLLEELRIAIEDRPAMPGFDVPTASVTELIDWIVARHHIYARRALAEIEPLAAKVVRVHGPHDARLYELLEVFRTLRDQLEPHLDREEDVLFPALRSRDTPVAQIADELRAMRDDHSGVGALLENMRALTDDYAAPTWGCGSYHSLMRQLELLDLDILRHVHLENHVLTPRVLEAQAEGSDAGSAWPERVRSNGAPRGIRNHAPPRTAAGDEHRS